MSYYMLYSRDDWREPWAPQFGDHDREVVCAERADYRDHGHKASHLMIVAFRRVPTTRQVNERTATLNSQLKA